MVRENRMKILVFKFWKQYFVTQGRTSNWERYVWWLKERKQKADKVRIEKELLEERMKHNDKVLRLYGLGKYQRKGYY
jgi:hypothetical protein